MDLVQVFRPAIVVDLSEYTHNMDNLLALSTNKVYFASKSLLSKHFGRKLFLGLFLSSWRRSLSIQKTIKTPKKDLQDDIIYGRIFIASNR